MKIDLDELERIARQAAEACPVEPWLWTGDQLTDYTEALRPTVAIALIARIREREAFARQLLREHEREPVDEAALHALLEKGAVPR